LDELVFQAPAKLRAVDLQEQSDGQDIQVKARYPEVGRLGRSDGLDSLVQARYLAVVEPVETGA
jgi:hypothetical protein